MFSSRLTVAASPATRRGTRSSADFSTALAWLHGRLATVSKSRRRLCAPFAFAAKLGSRGDVASFLAALRFLALLLRAIRIRATGLGFMASRRELPLLRSGEGFIPKRGAGDVACRAVGVLCGLFRIGSGPFCLPGALCCSASPKTPAARSRALFKATPPGCWRARFPRAPPALSQAPPATCFARCRVWRPVRRSGVWWWSGPPALAKLDLSAQMHGFPNTSVGVSARPCMLLSAF